MCDRENNHENHHVPPSTEKLYICSDVTSALMDARIKGTRCASLGVAPIREEIITPENVVKDR